MIEEMKTFSKPKKEGISYSKVPEVIEFLLSKNSLLLFNSLLISLDNSYNYLIEKYHLFIFF